MHTSATKFCLLTPGNLSCVSKVESHMGSAHCDHCPSCSQTRSQGFLDPLSTLKEAGGYRYPPPHLKGEETEFQRGELCPGIEPTVREGMVPTFKSKICPHSPRLLLHPTRSQSNEDKRQLCCHCLCVSPLSEGLYLPCVLGPWAPAGSR